MTGTIAFSPLTAEAVAAWYLRLNGFLMWTNFVVHPSGRGSQRTDADIVGVRFPFRRELGDSSKGPLQDDGAMALSSTHVELILAEVKTGLCDLNASWTDPQKENVQRVLRAVGCLHSADVERAAADLYARGNFIDAKRGLRIRLLAFGERENPKLVERGVLQVCWPQVASFLHQRFHTYARQKADVQQWDDVGQTLKERAATLGLGDFQEQLLTAIGAGRRAEPGVVAGSEAAHGGQRS